MKVFKFGGASVKSAAAIVNAVQIVRSFEGPLVTVVSAIGKTTNALENLWMAHLKKEDDKAQASLDSICEFHLQIIRELNGDGNTNLLDFERSLNTLRRHLQRPPSEHIAYEYDQIVSYGELWSTIVFAAALKGSGIKTQWFDARRIIRTSDHHQEGRVEWEKTKTLTQSSIGVALAEKDVQCAVTQGFIGHTKTGMTTTLGREGSDFSAAILAWALEAEEVWIWKDVPGLLNADPKVFDNPIKIDRISYKEAIELSYFGASVIHPKTLKPLQNKNIPLRIKSFLSPQEEGTIIHSDESNDYSQSSYIYKTNQLLITISPKDFSFIMEDHISEIFRMFSAMGVKVHLMQNSALDFSVCADMKKVMLRPLVEALSKKFRVRYNEDVELFTIRHYDNNVLPDMLKDKTILIQQRSRTTMRYVLR